MTKKERTRLREWFQDRIRVLIKDVDGGDYIDEYCNRNNEPMSIELYEEAKALFQIFKDRAIKNVDSI